MPKLRVQSFAISLDGYGAGPNQDLDNPVGAGGVCLADAQPIRLGSCPCLGRVLINGQIEGPLSGTNRNTFASGETYRA
jgi:hypothetical protein